MMKLLIEHGACLETVSGTEPVNALQWAVAERNIDAVELLLDMGMDIEKRCRRGYTPLSLAARSGDVKIATLLIQRGASIQTRCNEGKTPLILSSELNQVDTVKFWIEHGLDVNAAADEQKGKVTFSPSFLIDSTAK